MSLVSWLRTPPTRSFVQFEFKKKKEKIDLVLLNKKARSIHSPLKTQVKKPNQNLEQKVIDYFLNFFSK